MRLILWTDDGPPCAPRDISRRIEALYEPQAREHVKWAWIRSRNQIILARAGIVCGKVTSQARNHEKG